jgi:hypothetical protein
MRRPDIVARAPPSYRSDPRYLESSGIVDRFLVEINRVYFENGGWTERLSPSAGVVESGVMAEGVYFVDAVGRERARRTINERRPPCRHCVRG